LLVNLHLHFRESQLLEFYSFLLMVLCLPDSLWIRTQCMSYVFGRASKFYTLCKDRFSAKWNCLQDWASSCGCF
jgi:hypothetical protein